MDIVEIVKQSAALKEEINIKVFSHIFERYPPETDFDTVLEICSTDENESFSNQGYIVREHFGEYGDRDLSDLIDKMLLDYQEIVKKAYGLYQVLHKGQSK